MALETDLALVTRGDIIHMTAELAKHIEDALAGVAAEFYNGSTGKKQVAEAVLNSLSPLDIINSKPKSNINLKSKSSNLQ